MAILKHCGPITSTDSGTLMIVETSVWRLTSGTVLPWQVMFSSIRKTHSSWICCLRMAMGIIENNSTYFNQLAVGRMVTFLFWMTGYWCIPYMCYGIFLVPITEALPSWLIICCQRQVHETTSRVTTCAVLRTYLIWLPWYRCAHSSSSFQLNSCAIATGVNDRDELIQDFPDDMKVKYKTQTISMILLPALIYESFSGSFEPEKYFFSPATLNNSETESATTKCDLRPQPCHLAGL